MRDEDGGPDREHRPPEQGDAPAGALPIVGRLLALAAAAAGLLGGGEARAWYTHAAFMGSALKPMPQAAQSRLASAHRALCPPEEKQVYRHLAGELGLNPEALMVPASLEGCVKKQAMTLYDVLAGVAVDDPDQGMDRDLPDAADPRGDRRWMGGASGPSSQAFRHMYFGGWSLRDPIATFQIPPRALGQAPERVEFLANKARSLLAKDHDVWGIRILGWALHYVQDLAQPFHAVQLPKLAMVQWSELVAWPPGKAFDALVSGTARTISNYHWAYEGYVLERLRGSDMGPFEACIENPKASLLEGSAIADPRALAEAVAEASVRLAPELGASVMGFFGGQLMSQEYDLARKKGTVDYAELAIRPDLTEQRQKLHAVTCTALANAAWATRWLVQWALNP